jgi:hypothetical protein
MRAWTGSVTSRAAIATVVAIVFAVIMTGVLDGCILVIALALADCLASTPRTYVAIRSGLVAVIPVIAAMPFGFTVYELLPRARPRDGETRCGQCGYILKGLTVPRCSECGNWLGERPGQMSAGPNADAVAARGNRPSCLGHWCRQAWCVGIVLFLGASVAFVGGAATERRLWRSALADWMSDVWGLSGVAGFQAAAIMAVVMLLAMPTYLWLKRALRLRSGETFCGGCGAPLRRLEEPVCPRCGRRI